MLRTTLRSTLFTGAALTALASASAVAQEPDRNRDVDQDRDCVCAGDVREGFRFTAPSRRAQLGVMLDGPATVEGQTGARIAEVLSGGAAERAGLRAGDVVVALDDAPVGEDDPVAGIQARIADLEPGDTVAVSFYREDRRQQVRVVLEEGRITFRSMATPGFRVAAPRVPDMEFEVPSRLIRGVTARGLELVAVNPELGRFFGATRGVLVAEVRDESPLGLRTGDVILAIDGRDVRDPAHVRAILASYRPDEAIRFTVVRDERERTVEGRTR